MATAEWLATHPPVIAYLPPALYAQLQAYKTTLKVSMSEAIKLLLALGLPQQPALPPQPQDDALEETTPPQPPDNLADEVQALKHRVATLEAESVHRQGELSPLPSSSLMSSGQSDAVPEQTMAQARIAQIEPEHTANRLTQADDQKVQELIMKLQSPMEPDLWQPLDLQAGSYLPSWLLRELANLQRIDLSTPALLSPAPAPYGLLPPANSRQANRVTADGSQVIPWGAPLNAETSEPNPPLISLKAPSRLLGKSQPNQSRSSTAEAQVTSEPLRTETEQGQMEPSQPVPRLERTEQTDKEAQPQKRSSSDHAAAQPPKQKKKKKGLGGWFGV